MHVKPDRLNWTCINILVGVGDPYSFDAANAFEAAAIDNKIYVCTKVNYQPGSLDMAKPIKQIIDDRCCQVTVVFGQPQDISSLLLEAHKQRYAGEWIMGDDVMGSLATIVNHLRKHLDEDKITKLLTGMCKFYLAQV